MRMETNTERYDGFEQIFDGVQECPVDTEYTLPDYCADIQKILKCIVTPEVTSVSAAGGQPYDRRLRFHACFIS